jgi:nitric oxide synthase-interacting protein
MSRHSKNCNTRGFFTYDERQKLNYGTIKQRLGKDSSKSFSSCFLCLQEAIDPVCCVKGHLACKECFLENLFSQKQEQAVQMKNYELQNALEEQDAKVSKNAQEIEKIQQFQSIQTKIHPSVTPQEESSISAVQALKTDPTKINAFWLPENQPSALESKIEKPKMDLKCIAVDPSHTISLRKLIPVKFTKVSTDKIGKQEIICPSCTKTLTNGSQMHVLKQCGHVLCHICCQDFVKTSERCMVCDERNTKKDIVDLARDGTGYALHGHVQGVKVTEAFQ